MFILPTFENSSIKKIPWATIAIIVCCCWVFFVVQKGDDVRLENIILKYGQNGFLDMELEAYASYQKGIAEEEQTALPERDNIDTVPDIENERQYQRWMSYYFRVWQLTSYDYQFQNSLQRGLLIGSDSPRYEEWQELNNEYTEDLGHVIQVRYVFRTAWPDLLTSFTAIFLHGDFYHLLGNMVFLFAAGIILEAALGPWIFLIVYLVVGIAESWLSLPLQAPSAIGCLGASGAISGIMGAYSVLLGRTMVPTFAFFGFFFTTLRVPAFLLIIFWAMKEGMYYLVFPGSHINYLAHFSGFLCGGFIGLALKPRWGKGAKELFNSPQKNREVEIDNLVSKGSEYLRQLEPAKARRCLAQALEMKGDDIALLEMLFRIDKQLGDKKQFAQTANNFLGKILVSEKHSFDIWQYYQETTRALDEGVDADLLVMITRRMIRDWREDKVMQLLTYMRTKHPKHPELPQLLFGACKTAVLQRSMKCANQWASMLLKNYPKTSAAEALRQFSASRRKAA